MQLCYYNYHYIINILNLQFAAISSFNHHESDRSINTSNNLSFNSKGQKVAVQTTTQNC